MNAASLIVPDAGVAPLYWSLRLHRQLNRCPRGFFLRHFGAAGGYDPDAPPEARRLHLLKHLHSTAGYLRRTLADTLDERFSAGREDDATASPAEGGTALRGELLHRFGRDRRSMLLGEYLDDHRRPALVDWHLARLPAEALFRQVETELLRLAALPGLRELLSGLDAVPPLARLRLPRPLATGFGKAALYGAPVLAWRERRQVVFLELLTAGEVPEKPLFSMLIHRYYALADLKIPPERVSSRYFDCETGVVTEPAAEEMNFSAAIDRILADFDRMAGWIRPDRSVHGEDFPAAAETECSDCRFREFCRRA